MKTILIPIDFSAYANNAVRYSIQVAKVLNAKIHLCHAISSPEVSPIAGLVTWPLEDGDALVAKADEMMLSYIEKLKTEENLLSEITYTCEISPIKPLVNRLTKELKVDLIIAGRSGNTNLERFLLGSVTRDLIDNNIAPVLIVPKEAPYLPLKKIAFATDLSDSDVNSIHAIARLFCLYNPEILLTHVANESSDFHHPNSKSNEFLRSVSNKINYSKIYFRHVKEENINNGLIWLIEHDHLNMLSMIHRHSSSLFSSLMHSSHTKKMAKIIELPLLVMPEDLN